MPQIILTQPIIPMPQIIPTPQKIHQLMLITAKLSHSNYLIAQKIWIKKFNFLKNYLVLKKKQKILLLRKKKLRIRKILFWLNQNPKIQNLKLKIIPSKYQISYNFHPLQKAQNLPTITEQNLNLPHTVLNLLYKNKKLGFSAKTEAKYLP